MENQDKNHVLDQILAIEIIGGIENESNTEYEIYRELIKAGILTKSLDFTEQGQKLANLILIQQNKGKFRAFLKLAEELERSNIKKQNEN